MKKELKKLKQDELVDLIIEISKLNKENKSFLKSKLLNDENESFIIYCKKIDVAFSCYELMSLKDARQAINDFKKVSKDISKVIDLHIYYIESAYELEKTDWRFQENFYLAIESIFKNIVGFLKTNNSLVEIYDARLKKLIDKANEGWCHKDTLLDYYSEITLE